MWRPAHDDRVLMMAGQTTGYAVEPRGEYVFGVVAQQPMRSRRGRERRLVSPGQLVAWDPSGAHSGSAVAGHSWSSRLMVVEIGDLVRLASDQEAELLANVTFPQPVLSDPDLVAGFLRLHATLEMPGARLEHDELLAGWLRLLIERYSATPRRGLPSAGDEHALRTAMEYLADQPARNVGLDELAAAAGIGKFRLIRLCKERTGLPPHALQVAHRLRTARRLLEAGQTIADAASAAGFADQSHMHRHFQRSLGMTPGEYRRRLTA
jgi:AraC-like DNA-binding protein